MAVYPATTDVSGGYRPIDINHPGYVAANKLGASGWGQAPAPPLDFGALLANDQMLQGQFGQIGWGLQGPTGAGALGLANAPLDTRYRQALIAYGGIPSEVQIDNTTRQAALDATTGGWSRLAQLLHARRLSDSMTTGSAAGRGLGHSGEIGAGMLEHLNTYNVDRATAQANLFQTLSEIDASKGQNAQTAFGQAQTAIQDALDRIYGEINTGMIAAPVPPALPKNTYVPGNTYQIKPTPTRPRIPPRVSGSAQVAAPVIKTNPVTFTPGPRPRYGQYGGGPSGRIAVTPRGRLPLF